jgi:hypothetical protein
MNDRIFQDLSQFAIGLNSSFTSVNDGGCGVVASILGSQLSKFVPVRIIVASWGVTKDLNEVRKTITCNRVREWNKNDIHFGHVLVEFDHEEITYHLDTLNGVVMKTEKAMGMKIIPGYLTIEEITELTEDKPGWNSHFDRSQIPAIKTRIEEFFETTRNNGTS